MGENHEQKLKEMIDCLARDRRALYETLPPDQRGMIDQTMEPFKSDIDFLGEIVAKVATGQMSEADGDAWVDLRRREQDVEQMVVKGGKTAEAIEQAIKESYENYRSR